MQFYKFYTNRFYNQKIKYLFKLLYYIKIKNSIF